MPLCLLRRDLLPAASSLNNGAFLAAAIYCFCLHAKRKSLDELVELPAGPQQAWPARSAQNKGWLLILNALPSVKIKMVQAVIPKKRILVVDDEPFVCEAVKMMLAFDGHEVKTANSGKEALLLLEKDTFDLVITDFAMPAMKGDELAAAIKSRLPRQPVVMITAYAEMLQSSGDPLPGVDFLISKPFLLENLREAIAKVLPEKKSSPAQ
jgi:CheY-like chemotaxis protein